MPLSSNHVEYCQDWPRQYTDEKALLQHELGSFMGDIHHIGSTAIPGILAKPEIDILIAVDDFQNIVSINLIMESLGYRVRGECGVVGRHYFSKDTDGVRTHKVHVYAKGAPNIWECLAFRDYLNGHPDKRDEYGALKRRLAAINTGGMAEYCAGKDPFIESVLQLAQDEGYADKYCY